METTAEPRGTLGAQVAQLKGKIPLKKTNRERFAELTAMKADDLRAIAKGLGLTGYSSMRKDEIVAAIITEEIAKGIVLVEQPAETLTADAKGPTNGNGTTATQAASAASKELKVGDELTGTVSGINPSVGGMFVTLAEGKSGLAHERQIGLEGESRRAFIARLNAAFKQDETVAVRVTRVWMNEARGGKLEIGLELIGESRELFKNATIQPQEEQWQTTTSAAGNGENAGSTSTSSDTEAEAASAGDEPVQRQTSPDDEVMFRAMDAVGPVADIILKLDLPHVVDEGVRRSGGESRKKALGLKELIRVHGVETIRSFVEGFRKDVWGCCSWTRAESKDISFRFVGIALGCLPGMPRRDADELYAALRPFLDKELSAGQRAYDFADVVREEIAEKRRRAEERRMSEAESAVDVFALVSTGRPKPLARDTQAIQIGTVYDGKVVNVPEQGYGVFVEFEGGKGLVHISSMPGKPSREELTEQYPADKPIRVKLIEKNNKGYGFQFEEHAAKVMVEPRPERGSFPKEGNVYLGTVDRIGKLADTVVVEIDGHKGIIRTEDIGWGHPGRTEVEREEFRGRLGKTYSSGKQIPVEVTKVEKKWNGHLGKDMTYVFLKPIEPTEYARRKGGSHAQTGGGSRPATAAKPGADDKEAERATAASPTAEQEEQRETVDVDLDTVTGQPVECKQDPENGTCTVHTNGHTVTMMPGDHFCRVGKELIRQGGVPVKKDAEEPLATECGETDGEAAAKITRRGDGNVPSVMINTVTFAKLVEAIGEQANEDTIEILGEIRVLVNGRTLLTKEQAWAEKERMIALARKYGANDELMGLVTRRSYGTVEQVDRDVHYANGRAYKARLESAGTKFVCMAEGLGGHKISWFIGAGRTNQLHPELGVILLGAIPDRSPARPMATRIRREAEDGLPLCLKCADLRLGWVADLLSENGLIRGEVLSKLLDICPPNNSGRRHQVFTYINREPHQRAYEAYREAVTQKEEWVRAAEAAKDPTSNPGDGPETARAKHIARHEKGGAFSQDPQPAANYKKEAARKRSADDLSARDKYRGKGGGGGKQKQKDGGKGKKKSKK